MLGMEATQRLLQMSVCVTPVVGTAITFYVINNPQHLQLKNNQLMILWVSTLGWDWLHEARFGWFWLDSFMHIWSAGLAGDWLVQDSLVEQLILVPSHHPLEKSKLVHEDHGKNPGSRQTCTKSLWLRFKTCITSCSLCSYLSKLPAQTDSRVEKYIPPSMEKLQIIVAIFCSLPKVSFEVLF